MRVYIFLLLITSFTTTRSQDSSVLSTMANQLDRYTGQTFAPGIVFTDTMGKKITFESFKGKTCYIDFWFIGCKPCVNEIPYWKDRYKSFAADTDIVFITVCMPRGATHPEWKKYIADHAIPGIHLMPAIVPHQTLNEMELGNIFHIASFPSYMIVNPQGTLTGWEVAEPSAKMVADYIIYKAKRDIKPSASYRALLSEIIKTKNHTNDPAFVTWVETFYHLPFMTAMKKYLYDQ